MNPLQKDPSQENITIANTSNSSTQVQLTKSKHTDWMHVDHATDQVHDVVYPNATTDITDTDLNTRDIQQIYPDISSEEDNKEELTQIIDSNKDSTILSDNTVQNEAKVSVETHRNISSSDDSKTNTMKNPHSKVDREALLQSIDQDQNIINDLTSSQKPNSDSPEELSNSSSPCMLEPKTVYLAVNCLGIAIITGLALLCVFSPGFVGGRIICSVLLISSISFLLIANAYLFLNKRKCC